MKGITLTFRVNNPVAKDAMNNDVMDVVHTDVDNCLIAPITEPITARESQAITQSKDQVRIHLPKAYTGDVGGSEVDWGGKTFRVDSSGVVFMNENTPGDWNRYFRAEAINE